MILVSIKPIDFQVTVAKTSEVAKIHNDEEHKNQTLQQQQASQTQSNAEYNMKHVSSREKAQEGKIRERQEKNKNGSNKENKEDKDKKDKGKSNVKKTSTIDIRI